MNAYRQRKGFTMVELTIAVVGAGVLAGLVLPILLTKPYIDTQMEKTQAHISMLETIIGLYFMDVGEYPETLNDLVGPNGDPKWKGPYLKKKEIPKDAWGRVFIYNPDGVMGANFDLFSPGADGQEGTEDDITNWGTRTVQ